MIRFLKDRMSSISSYLHEEILKPNKSPTNHIIQIVPCLFTDGCGHNQLDYMFKMRKKCKSKGGLTRHMRAKNDNGKENSSITSEPLTFIWLLIIFNSPGESLLGNKFYPEQLR